MKKSTLDERLLIRFGTPAWPLAIYEAIALIVCIAAVAYSQGLHVAAQILVFLTGLQSVWVIGVWLYLYREGLARNPVPFLLTLALVGIGAAVSHGLPPSSPWRLVGDATVLSGFVLSRCVRWHPRWRPFAPPFSSHAA